jgi:PIN domain nuclease of toxin-antitoxin system
VNLNPPGFSARFIRNSGFYIILDRGQRGFWLGIEVKGRLKKIASDPMRLAQSIEASGFYELPVTARHAATVASLPPLHSDPFDRLLIAQAMSEPLHLITTDERLKEYSELVVV